MDASDKSDHIILSVWVVNRHPENLRCTIVSRFMFNASSAIQIGIKSKTAGPTQEFQSISIILLDMVTPTTNIGSIFGFAYFVIIPELFALYSMNCCNR